tara:strand:+ start:1 stop:1848 length:1848 start_codon:yes stop_codon:yes gene_type:complete
MAYDIGQGISDALGSIGEGLVTRKERREERDKLIGQYEAIEEFKYKEYQDLLNKGAGENVVKAAQTEYEKWAKRGDELADEPTKKIEGIIAEYDKGEVRKSRRLQNRAAELQIELSEATNPIMAKTKAAQLKSILDTNQATEDKRKQVKALGEFQSIYAKETSRQIPDTEEAWLEGPPIKGGTPTLDAYKSPAYWEDTDPEGFDKWRTRHLQDFAPVPPSDFGDNPYASAIVGRNAFGLYGPSIDEGELPAMEVEEPAFSEVPSYYRGRRDIMRPPSPQEQQAMSQELLARYAPELGPEYYTKAAEFAQLRHPMPTKGTAIEVEGQVVPGKINVQGNIITIPRGQGLGDLPKDMRVKGITYGRDKDGNPTQSVQLERYVKGEQPEFINTAKYIADNDEDVKLLKELAPTPGMAKEFNDFYSDSKSSIDTIGEILHLVEHGREGGSERPNWVDLSMPWPMGDRQLQGMIQVRIRTLTGKLRLPLIGPGAVSEYEQKLLKEAIADPTKFFSLTTTNKAKLKTLQTIMDRAIKVKGASMGLFEYNLEREPGLRPMTGSSSEGGSDLASRTFPSQAAADAANLPSGTEVYIDDPANLGRRKYVVPMSDAQRTAEIMDRP